MQTTDYISNDFKPLTLKSDLEIAKQLFSKLPHSHLPIVDKKMIAGSIARHEVEFTSTEGKKIVDFKLKFESFYTTDHANWFEVLQVFASNNTNILPVVNKNQEYLGFYELNDFLNIFKCTPFLHNEGVILVVSKNVNDYSFSEISQIVESNNATLFGAFISKIENDEAHIILKLSFHDINNTLHSFRRYNYKILNEFVKDDYLDELNERSDYLQKYLNI